MSTITNMQVTPEFVAIRCLQDTVEVTYRISYLSMANYHLPVCKKICLPLAFYEKRKHLFHADPRVTNHDPLSFHLFNRIMDSFQKDEIVVVEFGVWRGSFLENLAIHADETGKKLSIWGFDMFDEFPDSARDQDLLSRDRAKYSHDITSNKPFSRQKLEERLGRYSSIKDLHLVPGDITKSVARDKINADLVYFDMDFYETFFAAMNWLEDIKKSLIIVDDYYQPSWTGMVPAVNEFCEKQELYPVNISDFFRIERSHRTQWIMLLLPLLQSNLCASRK